MKTDATPSVFGSLRFEFFFLLILTLSVVGVNSAAAASSSRSPVVRAAAFLDAASRGSYVMSYLHMGTTYVGQTCLELAPVKDALDQPVPGEFALVYRYFWNDDDHTDVAYFFDERGNFECIRILRTTAVFQQPFVVSTGVVQVFGNALIEAFRKNLSESDRARLQTLVDRSDTKGLLELALRFQQAFGN